MSRRTGARVRVAHQVTAPLRGLRLAAISLSDLVRRALGAPRAYIKLV